MKTKTESEISNPCQGCVGKKCFNCSDDNCENCLAKSCKGCPSLNLRYNFPKGVARFGYSEFF